MVLRGGGFLNPNPSYFSVGAPQVRFLWGHQKCTKVQLAGHVCTGLDTSLDIPTELPTHRVSIHCLVLQYIYIYIYIYIYTYIPHRHVESRQAPTPRAAPPSPVNPHLFFTLVTGPRRSLSLKLSDTRVYESWSYGVEVS